VPELPEVEALAADLRERAVGRVIDQAFVAEFSVMKTYDPPLTALHDATLSGTSRRGKFLDLAAQPAGGGPPLHLVTHLAKAGWLRWREELPEQPPRPGKGPLAFRLPSTWSGTSSRSRTLPRSAPSRSIRPLPLRPSRASSPGGAPRSRAC
jgi:formamidopyrimidine-DNA glycosylase